MLQVRNGESEMLGVLFDRYQAPLFNFYTRLMGDRGASEDLVQEVFLRILRYRASYQPGTAFRLACTPAAFPHVHSDERIIPAVTFPPDGGIHL